MTPLAVLLDRFRRVPRVGAEVWQGGLVSLPTWVEGPDDVPMRPRAALWVSRRTGLIHLSPAIEFQSADQPFDVAVRAFAEFGLKRRAADCRPARVEVADADLAAHLRITLDDPELDFAVVDTLPDVQQVLRSFAERVNERPPLPDAIDRRYYVDHVLAGIADAILLERGESFDDAIGRRKPKQLDLL